MNQSLGLVEVIGKSTALVVADAMAKSANIKIIDIENSRGLGYMTIKIVGDVGAVNAAVSAGKQVGIESNHFVSSKVIPRPSNLVYELFIKKEEQEKTEDKGYSDNNQEEIDDNQEEIDNNQEEIDDNDYLENSEENELEIDREENELEIDNEENKLEIETNDDNENLEN